MRKLISLIENAQALITAEGFAQWLEHAENYFGESDIDYVRELIDEWGMDNYVQSINQQFGAMPDPLVAYRGLHVPQDIEHFLADMDKGRALGVSWTWEFGAAINENGEESGYGRHNIDAGEHTNLIIEAEVHRASIDWNYTAALTIAEFDEPEFRLRQGEAVFVKAIHLLDDFSYDKHGHYRNVSGTGVFSPESRDRIVDTIEIGKTFYS